MVLVNKPNKYKSTIKGHGKSQEAALQYDELAAIYDHAPIMMILLDEGRHVKQVNQATIKFVDHPQNDILEIRVGEVFNIYIRRGQRRAKYEGINWKGDRVC